MRKQKVIASPLITRFIFWDLDLFTKTVLEYVEFLRRKVKKGDRGFYYCGSHEDDNDKCWDKTERFCIRKGLDFEAFRGLLSDYGVNSNCESCIANEFDSAVFLKKMSDLRQNGN